MIESLSPRMLLAASVVFDSGILRIRGDSHRNLISVSVDPKDKSTALISADHAISRQKLSDITLISIDARGGNDSVSVSAPTTAFDVPVPGIALHGGAGNDVLQSLNSFGAQFFGDAGDDLLFGLGTENAGQLMEGGAGDDAMSVSLNGGNTLIGGLGNDTLSAYDGDYLSGGPGDDALTAHSLNDPLEHALPSTVIGGRGNDTIFCGTQPDLVIGGAGDDRITVADISTEDFRDFIGSQTISGNEGNDTLIGGNSNRDHLDGGDGVNLGF